MLRPIVIPAKSQQRINRKDSQTKTTTVDSVGSSTTPAPEPDNTNNQRDRAASLTADQQGNNKSDLELTASIRRSIVADDSLSTYGHNIKIFVKNGVATLKGPVRTEAEKVAITAKAAAVVGQDHIVDQMEITPQ